MSVVRRALFSIWKNEGLSFNKFLTVASYIFGNVIDKSKHSTEQCHEISTRWKKFASKLLDKWRACRRNQAYFEQKHKEWLNGKLYLVDQGWTPNVGRPVRVF